MRIDILTILPQLLESPLNDSIMKRAQKKAVSKYTFTISVTIRPIVKKVWMIINTVAALEW